MSTQFIGEGNIGSPPEYREFPNGNDDPRRLLRLNVYFDNPVPTKGGEFEDRGGFWAPVELWHHDADRWQQLYQKGMRVLVVGRMERDPWTDNEDQPRETWQVSGPGRLRGTFMKSSGFSAYHLFMASMGGTCPRAFWGMW